MPDPNRFVLFDDEVFADSNGLFQAWELWDCCGAGTFGLVDEDGRGKVVELSWGAGLSGEPVAWPVEVGPKTIFSYWPNKTVDDLSANLQAALMAMGKPEDEARRRTTCEVSSADPIAVRGYTRFAGQPTLVPVTAY